MAGTLVATPANEVDWARLRPRQELATQPAVPRALSRESLLWVGRVWCHSCCGAVASVCDMYWTSPGQQSCNWLYHNGLTSIGCYMQGLSWGGENGKHGALRSRGTGTGVARGGVRAGSL